MEAILMARGAVVPAAADDIAFVRLMTADGIGIALVVVFAELRVGKHHSWSLRL
jgi:hypothetical protein